MFLSYAVVPVFVFTVLLNFFNLYSPIVSQEAPCSQNFTSCEECHNSSCYVETNGTCAFNPDNVTLLCFKCATDASGNLQFDTEENCHNGCNDTTKACVCDGQCYSCLSSANASMVSCAMPTMAVDENCQVIPYGVPPPCTNTSAGTP